MKNAHLFLALGAFAVSTAFAEPTITSMTAAPDADGVFIDYVVSDCTRTNGASTITYVCTNLLLTATVGGVEIPARWLEGDISGEEGSHRIYWNMRYDASTDSRLANVSGSASINITLLYQDTCTDDSSSSSSTSGGSSSSGTSTSGGATSEYYVIDLSGGPYAASYPVTTLTNPNTDFNTLAYKTTKIVLRKVKAGSFIMGDDQTDESHRVTLTKPFYMGLFEVTQDQWKFVMGEHPNTNVTLSASETAVTQISFNDIRGYDVGNEWPTDKDNRVDADSFLGVLRARTGLDDLDLPTEAQWEYACRAGTKTTYSYGDAASTDYMWYDEDSGDATVSYSLHPVGEKAPNDWGFYDMLGNASEWCLDRSGTLEYGKDPVGAADGSSRVVRGGDCSSAMSDCTSATRSSATPRTSNDDYLGFRLACAATASSEDDTSRSGGSSGSTSGSTTGTISAAKSVAGVSINLSGSGTSADDGDDKTTPSADDDSDAPDFSSAQTYNGYLATSDETPAGTILVKTARAKANRKTGASTTSVSAAIMIAGEKKQTLKATLDTSKNAVSIQAKDGRLLALTLTADGLSGSFDDYVIDGARDVFSSKADADKKTAAAALKAWQGALAIASDDAILSVSIASKGKARISGTLASGTKVSASAQMIVGANGTCCIPVAVSTRAVQIAFCLELDKDGETASVTGLGDDATCGRPGALADDATFNIDTGDLAELLGDDTYFDDFPDGLAIVQSGTRWVVQGDNTSRLKLAYKKKTGLFSGSFKAFYADARGRKKSKSVTVTGVCIDGVGHGLATIKKVGSVSVTIGSATPVTRSLVRTASGVSTTATSNLTDAEHANYCVVNLSGSTLVPYFGYVYLKDAPTGGFNVNDYKTKYLVLKKVKSGSFIMGNDPTDEDYRETIESPFFMGLFEVTQKQWELVMGDYPHTTYLNDFYPAVNVSYNDIRGAIDGAQWPQNAAVDAESFVGQLQTKTAFDVKPGLALDLPTEAQWEYVCRAGTTTTYSYGDDADGAYMWYFGNANLQPRKVGVKDPNTWGFYDMHGNANEWCLDWDAKSLGLRRILRGGCWKYKAADCASAFRTSAESGTEDVGNGLRLSLNF
jgi:formylglycine-generating enzyme required for sulfatase activity